MQLGVEQHLPKICILNPTLAVGFSGSPDLATAAIREAPKNDGVSYGAVTQHFLGAHLQHDQGIEFILALGPPLSKLALISSGTITQNRPSEWIGDQAGFEAFQDFRHNRKPILPFVSEMMGTNKESEAKQPTFDMIGSMGSVIRRQDVPSVFGHPVGMSNVDGQFEFRSYWSTLEEKPSFQIPAGSNPMEVLSQIAESQQYAFSCFVSSPSDPIQAVAFHYMRGKITYVYHGDLGAPLDNFVLYRDLNVIEVGERAKQDLRLNWVGGISSRTGQPPGYGIPPEQWRTMRPDGR